MNENTNLPELLDAVNRLHRGRVLILGDMILDEYIYGSTRRISREAPVLIVRHEQTQHAPGGAANTAANVARLGGKVTPVGLVGDDEEGRILVDLLNGAGIDTGGILVEGGILTTKKTRVMAGDYHTQRQQVLRLDRETRMPVTEAARSRLLGALADYVDQVDVVLLADYGLGCLDPIYAQKAIGLARNREKPVVADSRFRLEDFGGATVVCPNETEMLTSLGFSAETAPPIEEAGSLLLEKLQVPSALVTRGSLGMAVFLRGEKPCFLPIAGSDQVTDLSGAGDTVAAVIALSLSIGLDLVRAALVATYAAGVVVMKRGTSAVTPEEVRECMTRTGPLAVAGP
jgi:rfaE bifunctional protein kinase chain/domain